MGKQNIINNFQSDISKPMKMFLYVSDQVYSPDGIGLTHPSLEIYLTHSHSGFH